MAELTFNSEDEMIDYLLGEYNRAGLLKICEVCNKEGRDKAFGFKTSNNQSCCDFPDDAGEVCRVERKGGCTKRNLLCTTYFCKEMLSIYPELRDYMKLIRDTAKFKMVLETPYKIKSFRSQE